MTGTDQETDGESVPRRCAGDGVPQPFRAAYRILVADDNQDTVESLRLLLHLLGGDIRTASDGLQALEMAESFQPHAVVLDIGMPKLHGYEVARRIRLQDWGKCMVLIALSGWCREEDRRASQAAGFDGHLPKPIRVEELRESIQRLLDADLNRGP
jgi:CheY-like chemotaxis protein